MNKLEERKIEKLALKKKLESMRDKYNRIYREGLSEDERKMCFLIIDDVDELIRICQTRNKF